MGNDERVGLPPYLAIAADLRDQIESGELAPGDKLPSIDALSRRYECAKTTAAKALRVLRDEGLIFGRQGWGTFVSQRKR